MATAMTGTPEGNFVFFDLDFQPAFMSSSGLEVAGTTAPPTVDAKLWVAGAPAHIVEIGNGLQLAGLAADGSMAVGTLGAPPDCLEVVGAEAVIISNPGGPGEPINKLATFRNLPQGVQWTLASGVGGPVAHVMVGTAGIGDAPCSGMPGSFVSLSQGFWTPGGMITDVGPLAGDMSSEALAVSADGSTAFGVSFDASGAGRLFVQSPAGETAAVTQPQASVHLAEDGGVDIIAGVLGAFISADGSVVAGTLIDGQEGTTSFAWRAFRWTRTGGLTLLDLLPGMAASAVVGLSADGATVVGYDASLTSQLLSETNVGFRWTTTAGVKALPSKSPTSPYIVNADASVVVGGGAAPTLWNGSNPGIPLFASTPSFAARCASPVVTAISDNGLVFAGICSSGEPGWVALRPSP